MQVRIFTRLLVLRYLGFCNVLRIWSVRAIPTYRVYRLYDTSKLKTPLNIMQPQSHARLLQKSKIAYSQHNQLVHFLRPNAQYQSSKKVMCQQHTLTNRVKYMVIARCYYLVLLLSSTKIARCVLVIHQAMGFIILRAHRAQGMINHHSYHNQGI